MGKSAFQKHQMKQEDMQTGSHLTDFEYLEIPLSASLCQTEKTDRRPTEISCLFESCCANGKALINRGVCLRLDATLIRHKVATFDEEACFFQDLQMNLHDI